MARFNEQLPIYMCVCVCVCIYMCVCVCIYICVCVCIYIYFPIITHWPPASYNYIQAYLVCLITYLPPPSAPRVSTPPGELGTDI